MRQGKVVRVYEIEEEPLHIPRESDPKEVVPEKKPAVEVPQPA